MPNPQPGGLGFDCRVCSPREVRKHLRSPPYASVVGQSLSGSSAETCLARVTLAVAMLLSA
jgi:hypothetical protein